MKSKTFKMEPGGWDNSSIDKMTSSQAGGTWAQPPELEREVGEGNDYKPLLYKYMRLLNNENEKKEGKKGEREGKGRE